MLKLLKRTFKKKDSVKQLRSRTSTNWIFASLPLILTVIIALEYRRSVEDPNFLLSTYQEQIIVTGYAISLFILIIISAIGVWLTLTSKYSEKDIETVKKLGNKNGDIELKVFEKAPIKVIKSSRYLFILYILASIVAVTALQIEGVNIKAARESTFGEKHTLNIRLNERAEVEVTTNRDFYILEENGEGFLRYTTNLFLEEPITNHITFFESKQDMLKYFDGKESFRPEDKILSEDVESISYYLNERKEKGQYGYGNVLIELPYERIKIEGGLQLRANYIVRYVNRDPKKTETDSGFSSESEVQSRYCLLDLNQINSKAEGFLMFSGVRSIGTYVDYCESLRDMRDFKIEVNIK